MNLRVHSRWRLALAGLFLSCLALVSVATAQSSEAASDPPVPAYFTSTSPEGAAPLWPDPTGANAGTWIAPAGDGKGDANPATMTPADVYNRVAHNLFSINMMWVLIAGFMVMFMQAGFALVETGLCRAKHAGHTMAMNFMVYPLGCFAFFAYGFALGWGNWWNAPVGPGWYSSLGPGTAILNSGWGITIGEQYWGLVGLKGFFLADMNDVSVLALFFFMMVFMDTTATIPTGAMAERWAWKNFVLYALWVALPYCLFANWVWGGGWLAALGKNVGLGHGAVDFAGSAVVHAMGGAIALAGALVIGPRMGKFTREGKPRPLPGHSVPYVVVGTFILAFGWFGFNPGSTLSGTDLRIAVVVVNTMLAGIGGAIGAHIWLSIRGLKPDPTMLCNGMLAGLVGVTAPCAFISSWAALLIGLLAGVLVIISVFFIESIGIDDPCGAISVHGVCGVWGVLALGLFANGEYGAGWNGVEGTVKGIFYGDSAQFIAQLITALTVVVFGFVMAFGWFKLSNLITPIRVSDEAEEEGLDVPETGIEAYPEFEIKAT